MKAKLALAAALLLAGCAGRTGHPVAISNGYDAALSCQQMQAEIQANQTKATQVAEEKNSAENGNIAVGAVGALLFWPALFALDLSDAEQREMDALEARNSYLQLMMQTTCSGYGVRTAFDPRALVPSGAARNL